MALLEAEHLEVRFQTRNGEVVAVRDMSFALKSGKTLALVGESGSGKSVTAMSILQLLGETGKITGGEIRFQDGDKQVLLHALPLKSMQKIRGNKISMIFQEPMTALNPVLTVKKQLTEPFIVHQAKTKKQAEQDALHILESVRIPNPKRVLNGYPHQLSGGMRQRVMISMALACQPKILIADEPTTALDVTVQAQILRLIKQLQEENGTSVLFITHDLGVVNEIADEVAVAYAGTVVELALKRDIFRGKYSHPYTQGLLRSLPSASKKGGLLESIAGSVPKLNELVSGCKFAPRCPYKTERCIREEPPLFEVKKGQFIRCYYPDKEERNGRENVT